MFDEVTKTEGGKKAAKRAGFVFGSTVFQVALIFVIIWASAIVKAKVIDEPKVEVKFVKAAAPPPPAPPAPPPPPAAPKPPSERKPPTNAPRPPPPQALIQPQEVKAEMKVDPNEPKEPEYDYSGGGEGVVGGVVGGVAPEKAAATTVEDAPIYPSAGYKKAQAADPGCVITNVLSRMNDQDMDRLHGGVVTIQFAVGRDGQTTQFKVMTSGVSDRAKGAIWAAIQSCKWVPGADPSGKPVALLVTLPLRFKQE